MSWKNPLDMFWTSSVEPRIYLLYFLLSVGMGIPWSALALMLTREIGLSMEQMNKYYAITHIPWGFKLVFGYISDALPIFRHRRIPYFVFYCFVAFIVYLIYGFVITGYKSALIMGIIVNTAECAAQLMVDTLVVERVYKETEDEGRGQSLSMAARTAGTVVATILSLILMLDQFHIPLKVILALAGVCYLLAGIVALKIEDRVVMKYSFLDTIVEGVKLIFCGRRGMDVMSKNKPLFPLMLFILIRSAMPQTTTNVYSFLSMTVSVKVWQYNTLNISTSLASLIASFVYSRYLIGRDLATVIIATTCGAFFTSILQIYFVSGLFEGAALFWVTIILMDLDAFMQQLMFIPMLIMVSRACPQGYEASMWSIFFSINDLAGSLGGSFASMLSSYLGITYEDYSNLYKYVIICSILILVPLIYLFFIRDYFKMISNMSDPNSEVRGGLRLIVNEETEILNQQKIYNGN